MTPAQSTTAPGDGPARTLRLILGDQLNAAHSWYRQRDPDTLYLIAELRQETDYTRHHVQKVCAFFAAMRAFAAALEQAGHRVLHLTLDATADCADLPALLRQCLERYHCRHFEYQRPDEYRLAQQLAALARDLEVTSACCDSEHFLLPFEELGDYVKPAKSVRMEGFYRKLRRRFRYLMDGEEPVGGRWNYDSENRESLSAQDIQALPEPLLFSNPVGDILERLAAHGVETFGRPEAQLPWPVTREQARQLLRFFCETCLPHFGTFQDAMTAQSPHAWSLYHSRLSFALNAKLLSPREVLDAAVARWQTPDTGVGISQVEGFVRQILGWREYVRAMYWINMPDYAARNALDAQRALPAWFWTGETRMNCLRQAIGQSLQYAYAHHIQRLMITGNFALLAGIDPDAVDAWYLGVYIDAIEWVELPNTRGMALFADGGWIASKPYAASGNYVNRMSDYCRDCHYAVRGKTQADACPLNSLYWHFIDRHAARLAGNQRMALPLKNWQRQAADERERILRRAEDVLASIEVL
ncbi:cryptochrome/photolyase family protein [Mangrovimicrobium sediminis]|uniref:Cryptochrome/photolyase family protein n=1 Tax=Mangrovimicrobium sediminis TaxID=2562682 RepID=A0A4Z0M5U2_9GAMM|nr:cryptochrome/photolyase family protein [Haliea sp. SAOS-164]TGD74861.1 cryptochrome/photolyase family protein [Haliea sp. SAOS-164]